MKLQSCWTFHSLCCAVLAATTALAASAQSPKLSSSSDNYIIMLKVPGLDSADAMATRRSNVVPAAVYWDNLYNVGKVALLGSAHNGEATYRVVIVEGVSEDQAKTIANSDPNVKAGAATAEVIPLYGDLTRNRPSRPLPTRR